MTTYTRRQLAELAGLLSGALANDYHYRDRYEAMYRDRFDAIVAAYKRDPKGFRDFALESVPHAGYSREGDYQTLESWIEHDLLYPDGSLNVEYLWDLTIDSTDDDGNDVPCPIKLGE